MRVWVWVSASLAPVLLVGGWIVAEQRQRQHFDARYDTISALAAHGADDAWIMTVGLAGLGVCHVVTATGFTMAGRAARTVLAVGGVATVAVSLARQPSPAHVPAAAVAFVALALWPACARGVRFGRRATLVLLALLAWFGVALALTSLVGLSERALAGAEAMTPLVLLVSARAADPSLGVCRTPPPLS